MHSKGAEHAVLHSNLHSILHGPSARTFGVVAR